MSFDKAFFFGLKMGSKVQVMNKWSSKSSVRKNSNCKLFNNLQSCAFNYTTTLNP